VRALFYSHDGLGLGHVRRNLAIADAMLRLDPDASVLLVCSTDQVDSLVLPPRVDVLKLPGVQKLRNESYSAKRLPLPGTEIWSLRSALIASATRSFRPDVLLSDKHPHGAHGELREALGALHAGGGRAVLGLRDILDDSATVRTEWAHGRVMAAVDGDYQRVLVYGSPDVLDPVREYDIPPSVASMLRYCGYVASTPPDEQRTPLRTDDDPRPTVVATAGGGADGSALLADFVRASHGAPWHPVVVSGGDCSPADQVGLRDGVRAVGGTYHRFVRNLPVHFPSAAAVVCMGGYNTVAEALGAAVPTVVVPRVAPRQEQLLRASAFAALGAVRMVHPDRLGGPALREAVCAAMTDDRSRVRAVVARHLDLDGARRAGAHLLAVAAGNELDDGAARPVELSSVGWARALSPTFLSETERVDVAV
jgi:predicted glycosyltransferase